MRYIRQANEIQDKIDELVIKLQNSTDAIDAVLVCGWIQALIWVWYNKEVKK